MGLSWSSVELHDAERSMRLKLTELEPLDYCEQPDDDVLQLDTENDQRGSVAVEHLYKKIREVYGQPPRDLRHKFIDFGEDVVFKAKRPSPYDFPAFEHEKLLNEANDRMRLSQETMTREERRAWLAKSSAGLVSKEVVKSKETKEIPKAESKEKGQAGVEVTARSDGNSKSKMKSKGAESKNQAPPKVSHNEALDHCSLEDE